MSKHEDAFAFQIKVAGIQGVERQFRFDPDRRWRLDFAHVAKKVGVEVDGGIWVQGRHGRGAGILSDCEKLSTAVASGWRILRVAPEHIKSGEALKWLEMALSL